MNWRRIAIYFGVAIVVLFVVQRLISPSDEYDIENAIDEAATSSDPSYCTEVVTPAYLGDSYGLPPDQAVGSCEQYAGEEILQADSVSVDSIEVEGDRATAEAAYAGGALSGSTARLGLVKEEGDWKLDELLEIVRFDRTRFLDAYRDRLVDPFYGFPPASADCVTADFDRLSDANLKELLVNPNPARTGRILIRCDRRATERLILAPLEDPPPLAAPLINCVRQATRAASDPRLLELRVDATALAEVAIGCDRDAYLENYYLLLVGEPYDYPPEQALCVRSTLADLSDAALARVSYDRSRIEELIEECEDAELPPSPFPE